MDVNSSFYYIICSVVFDMNCIKMLSFASEMHYKINILYVVIICMYVLKVYSKCHTFFNVRQLDIIILRL